MPRPPPEAPLLGIEGLAGRRGDRLLFSGLSAVARSGEALRLRGPNGCGKTTALRIVCGLLPPEAGRIRWRGRVVSEPSEPSRPSDPSEPPSDPGWRRELAFVGHREALKETLTPLENLAFARALRGGRARRRPEEALERAGITVNKNTVPGETRSPFVTSGLRIGTPALTTRGMGPDHMRLTGGWIADVIENHRDEGVVGRVQAESAELCKAFPLFAPGTGGPGTGVQD